MSKPHKCPVCEGTGNVPNGFYDNITMVLIGQEICRTCNGRGIVWDEANRKQSASLSPYLTEFLGDEHN